jgi:16S rRNA (guanine966-N2)-methyltransferase
MRVIAGSIKGRRLQGPKVDDLSIRPTSDRAKEAIFSILQSYTIGSFLDLFSGTGAIAVEAWSRGYRPVTCIEIQPSAIACIANNIRGTGVKIITNDIRHVAVNSFSNQAVIFADPPYAYSTTLWRTMSPIICNWLIPNCGILVWETDRNTRLDNNKNLVLIDTRYYGNNAFHIFSTL